MSGAGGGASRHVSRRGRVEHLPQHVRLAGLSGRMQLFGGRDRNLFETRCLTAHT